MLLTPLTQHLEKLPAFVMVARLGSITKAAKVLAITQAALSQSIKALENALEINLFTRSRRGVKVTEEALPLLRYGEQLLEELELLDVRLRNPRKEAVKRIRIGTHEALATHIWPDLVESFQRENPGFFLSIVSGRVEDLIQQVLEKSLDLMVTVRPKTVRGLSTSVLYKETLEFYGPADRKRKVAGKKIEGQKLDKSALSKIPILTDRQAHLADDRSVSRILTELGLFSAHFYQLNSFDASLRLAEKGIGIALLPSKIGNSEPKKVRKITVTDLANKHFDHCICTSYLDESKSTPDTKLLLGHLRNWSL